MKCREIGQFNRATKSLERASVMSGVFNIDVCDVNVCNVDVCDVNNCNIGVISVREACIRLYRYKKSIHVSVRPSARDLGGR